ncbi:hypothetical protein HDV05_007161 [Chytridiales sp. JEL 0842]|nr:hypothetical protein HDV05_007161 [Chytridiales sp. JEL 0842]
MPFYPLSTYFPTDSTTSPLTSRKLIAEYQDFCITDRDGEFSLADRTSSQGKAVTRDVLRYKYIETPRRIALPGRTPSRFAWKVDRLLSKDVYGTLQCSYYQGFSPQNRGDPQSRCEDLDDPVQLYDGEKSCIRRRKALLRSEPLLSRNLQAKEFNRFYEYGLSNAVSRYQTPLLLMGVYYSATDGLDQRPNLEALTVQEERSYTTSLKASPGGLDSVQQCSSPQSISSVVVLPYYERCTKLTVFADDAQFEYHQNRSRVFAYSLPEFVGYSVYNLYKITRIYPDRGPEGIIQMDECIDDKCTQCFPSKTYAEYFQLIEPSLQTPLSGLSVNISTNTSTIQDPPCRRIPDLIFEPTYAQTFFIDTRTNGSAPLNPFLYPSFANGTTITYLPLIENKSLLIWTPQFSLDFFSPLFSPYFGVFLLFMFVFYVWRMHFMREAEVEYANRVANMEMSERNWGLEIWSEEGGRVASLADVRIPVAGDERMREGETTVAAPGRALRDRMTTQ